MANRNKKNRNWLLMTIIAMLMIGKASLSKLEKFMEQEPELMSLILELEEDGIVDETIDDTISITVNPLIGETVKLTGLPYLTSGHTLATISPDGERMFVFPSGDLYDFEEGSVTKILNEQQLRNLISSSWFEVSPGIFHFRVAVSNDPLNKIYPLLNNDKYKDDPRMEYKMQLLGSYDPNVIGAITIMNFDPESPETPYEEWELDIEGIKSEHGAFLEDIRLSPGGSLAMITLSRPGSGVSRMIVDTNTGLPVLINMSGADISFINDHLLLAVTAEHTYITDKYGQPIVTLGTGEEFGENRANLYAIGNTIAVIRVPDASSQNGKVEFYVFDPEKERLKRILGEMLIKTKNMVFLWQGDNLLVSGDFGAGGESLIRFDEGNLEIIAAINVGDANSRFVFPPETLSNFYSLINRTNDEHFH